MGMQGRGNGIGFAIPSDLLRQAIPNMIVVGNASGKGLYTGGMKEQ